MELPAQVADLAAAVAAAEQAMVRVVARLIERRDTILAETGVTTDVWLATVTKLPRWERVALLRAADVLPAMPATWSAWQHGALSWTAVRTITLRVARLSRDLVAEADTVVADAVAALGTAEVDHVVEVVDDWHAQVTARQQQRREDRDRDVLHLQPRLDGTGGTLWGDFGAVSFAVLSDAIDAATTDVTADLDANPGGDPQIAAANAATIGQARAAGLLRLCSTNADDQPKRPLLLATVTLETLLGMDELPSQLRTTLPGGTLRVTAKTARRLADLGCDLRLNVTDADGAVIGVGRTQRLAPGWLRTAMLAFHATCAAPGCRRPARHCDVDHATDFHPPDGTPGGPTDANNLAPACRSHHTGKRRGWQVTVDDDWTITWTHPQGAQVTQPAIPTLQRLARRRRTP